MAGSLKLWCAEARAERRYYSLKDTATLAKRPVKCLSNGVTHCHHDGIIYWIAVAPFRLCTSSTLPDVVLAFASASSGVLAPSLSLSPLRVSLDFSLSHIVLHSRLPSLKIQPSFLRLRHPDWNFPCRPESHSVARLSSALFALSISISFSLPRAIFHANGLQIS